MAQKQKKKKWIRWRHRISRALAGIVLVPYQRLKYGIRPARFREQGNRPYLILYNHQTPFDQFFVGASFRGPVYYVATEDLFSNGWISSLIRFLVAPIPIVKQTTDISAVMTILRVAREGGTIAIAPEGNRTYSGRTETVSPSIAPLARKTGLPIALYRIEGGYGKEPRWSDCVRKGRMRSGVVRVIEPEEYAGWDNDRLYSEILRGITVDENVPDALFRSNRRAEYLERCMYYCPFCGLSVFESAGNRATCQTCGTRIEYGEDKRLSGLDRDFPFRFIGDWYDAQEAFVRTLDLSAYRSEPAYRDRADCSRVILFSKKVPLRKQAALALYGDRISVDEGEPGEIILPFGELTAAAVLGRNKLNLYHGETVYQFRGDKRFNAVKYVNFFYRWVSENKGDGNGEFLGL